MARIIGLSGSLRQLLVFEARKMFDESGKLVDRHTRERMVKLVAGYSAFVAASAQRRN